MLSDFAPRDSSEIILPPLKHKSGYGLDAVVAYTIKINDKKQTK